MGKHDYYRKGDYNIICDRCGSKFKASNCRLEWDNLFVCSTCFDIRQPQDFVKGKKDDQRVPIARPRSPNKFVNNQITLEDII